MAKFFEISAYNTPSIYVWGDEHDVDRYVDWLNKGLEINLYAAGEVPEDQWDDLEAREDVMSMEEPYWDDFMEDE